VRVADLHADVICKLLEHPNQQWNGAGADEVFDATPGRLKDGGVALQVFPLYVPEGMSLEPATLLRAAELFWSEVLTVPGLKLIRRGSEIEPALESGRIGAIFSLEGADALRGEIWALQLLHRLGLRLLGPTWNNANWACDGALEPRGGGLTKAGKQLVKTCAALGILIDVSHLSERGFWDVADMAAGPYFASHSNSRVLRDHPRNLTDDQIKTLIAASGLVGLTFVPWFLTASEPASLSDVLRHVEHVCQLGGAASLAFGSDFDGISRYVSGLEHPGRYPELVNALLRYYPENLVKGFMADNAIRYFTRNLRN